VIFSHLLVLKFIYTTSMF